MQAELAISEHCLPVNIIDLSLNGALLCADTQEVVFSNKMGLLSFKLHQAEEKIQMNVVVVHQEKIIFGYSAVVLTSIVSAHYVA